MPSSEHLRIPELLAPAGSPDAFTAAVANGADAVYLGLGSLNARRNAENFDLESLARATRFAHLHGAKVYLTANIVVLPDEMQRSVDLVDAAWAAGIDAVIVQDLGLLGQLHRLLPHVRLHASTQIDAHNVAAVRALAGLGCSRVTLARELTIAEVAAIAATGVEVEAFVHGSLCYCYSGQCLMSSMIGGRSANRGLCAQPCRMPYALVDAAGDAVATPGAYLLSPRDLAGIGQLPALARAGVASLKIEGRMKAPEYVAVVVGVYRAALDRYAAAPDAFEVKDGERELLEEAFSRGFSEAYLAGIRDERMMSLRRPNNRGVLVGRVARLRDGMAEVALDKALHAEDTVEFWTRKGRFAQATGPMRLDGRVVTSAPAGATVALAAEGALSAGDRVFRVANASMLAAARRTFEGRAAEERHAVPVDIRVRLRFGEPLAVVVAADGMTAEAQGAPVQPARTRAVTAAEVGEHVGRLGGSGYRLASLDIDLDHGVGVGFSALHALRREALDALDARRLTPWADRAPAHLRVRPPAARPRVAGAPELVACVPDVSYAEPCLRAGATHVLVRASGHPTARSDRALPLFGRVMHEPELAAALRSLAPDVPIAAGNLGLLAAAGAAGIPVEADWPLNVLNAWSAEALASLGASAVWASHELSREQLAALAQRSPLPVGAVVYGRVELMVAEHCALQALGRCDRRCATCAERAGSWSLRDRKGFEFPVRTDAAGRSHIYNAATLDLIRALPQVMATGVGALRLDFTVEPLAECVRVTAAYRRALDAVLAGADAPSAALAERPTSGRFFHGVR